MASAKPRKQRKRAAQAPWHRRRKLASAPIDPKLREKQPTWPRALPVREGDSVEIVRGSLKGTRGEVTEVDTATGRVTVEGVTIRKADQTEVARPVHASNVVIVKLNDSDPWRQRMLRRGGGR